MPRPLDRQNRGGPAQDALLLRRRRRHRPSLILMTQAGVPFLVGSGYALRHYTGDVRGTKDLDVFVRRREARALLEALSAAGSDTDLTFPHWLGKARIEGDWIDVIYSSGNGLADVDDAWFTSAVHANVLGVPVRLCPPEEMIWSKAFVMERERYDGADISHLIRSCHGRIDWGRLIARFGPHWRILFNVCVPILEKVAPASPPFLLVDLEHQRRRPPRAGCRALGRIDPEGVTGPSDPDGERRRGTSR